MPSAEQMEAYVKSRWEWVQVRLAEPFEGIAEGKWTVRLFMLPFSQIGFDTDAAAWQSAYDFTLAHERKIADKLEEIAFIEADLIDCEGIEDMTTIAKRILSGLQAELTVLRAGMRGE